MRVRHTDNSYETYAATNNLSLNQWHHIAWTFNGFDLRCYIDGILTDSWSRVTVKNIYNVINIGKATAYTNFHGFIDEVRISDKARSLSGPGNDLVMSTKL